MKNKKNLPRHPRRVTKEDVMNCYRRYAPVYDNFFGRVLHHGRKAIIKEVKEIKPRNILEVGVGTGLMLPMYPDDIPVTGIDISGEMLAKAQKRIIPGRPTEVSLLEANGEELPFDDNFFSCVILPYTYSVTPNPAKLAGEIRRVCQKGGTIIIANHFSDFMTAWKVLEKASGLFTRKIGFNSNFSYREHVEGIDWEIVKTYPVNLLKLSRLVVIRNN